MTKETKEAWEKFASLLHSDLNKKSCEYWKKRHNNRAIKKAYKLINKGINCLRKIEQTEKEK